MRILKARYRSTEEFLEAYNSDLPSGGLFCPTTTELRENEPVVLEVHFPSLPNKMMVRGRVIWWRSALPRLRVRAGALVAFHAEDRESVEFAVALAHGEGGEAIKRRHPRIPITLEVKVRQVDAMDRHEGRLQDISIGGALLFTEHPVQADQDLIIELQIPGGAQAIDIAARVTHVMPGGAGLRFIYRDGGGSQRLREVVRRLVARG